MPSWEGVMDGETPDADAVEQYLAISEDQAEEEDLFQQYLSSDATTSETPLDADPADVADQHRPIPEEYDRG